LRRIPRLIFANIGTQTLLPQCNIYEKVRMRKTVLSTVAVLLCAGQAFAASEHTVLSGQELLGALSGRTVYIQTPVGEEIAIRYRANGTMAGSSSYHLAALAGESVRKDQGRWWVQNSQLCQKWTSWSEGRLYCYRLSVSGKRVVWSRNDGETGTARLD
jgi:hypothetical protein